MKEAKILLTINLEGVLSNKTEGHILPYVQYDVKGKQVIKTGTFVHKERLNQPCVKKTRLSDDAYKHFISKEIPSWYKAKNNNGKAWDKLTPNEKISQHCERIAEGQPFSFVIIDN